MKSRAGHGRSRRLLHADHTAEARQHLTVTHEPHHHRHTFGSRSSKAANSPMSLRRAISPRRMQAASVSEAGNVHSTVIPDGDPGRFTFFALALEGLQEWVRAPALRPDAPGVRVEPRALPPSLRSARREARASVAPTCRPSGLLALLSGSSPEIGDLVGAAPQLCGIHREVRRPKLRARCGLHHVAAHVPDRLQDRQHVRIGAGRCGSACRRSSPRRTPSRAR